MLFRLHWLDHRWVWFLCTSTLLAGCAGLPDPLPTSDRALSFTPNDFDSAGDVHTRRLRAGQPQTCEAARLALLSQGYIVGKASDAAVEGRKFYQPSPDVHYEVKMSVVCAADARDATRTMAFASAVQDRYVIKKVNNSASVGVGGLGSLSLPVNSTDDTLVKVGSETIGDAQFYQRFFDLFARYLPAPDAAKVTPRADVQVQPVAQPQATQQDVQPLPDVPVAPRDDD